MIVERGATWEGDFMKCTCTTDLDELRSTIEIKTCSLCKAAPDLLEACKLALSDFQEANEKKSQADFTY